MSGFIKLHRGWHESDLFKDNESYCERMAWLWLIENAAWKDTTRYNHKGEIIEIKRGQIHVSLSSLETAFNWSKKKVRGFIDRLEKRHMVGAKKAQSGTLLTICNYAKYQDNKDVQGHGQGTAKGTDGAQLGHTQEEGKEIKEDKIDYMSIEKRWNEMASANGLTKIKKLDDKRRAHIKSRIAEHGLDAVHEAMDAIPRSDFLLGRQDGSNWKANFDFLCQPSSFLKLIEGAYGANGSTTAPTVDKAAYAATMARLKAKGFDPDGSNIHSIDSKERGRGAKSFGQIAANIGSQ